MPHPVLERLQKQASDLEAKGAMRTKHEDLTLGNLKAKIEAVKRSAEDAD